MKPLGSDGESAYGLLRRDKWVRVRVLWETAKVETTLGNAQDAGKRWSALRSPRGRRRRNNAVGVPLVKRSRLVLTFAVRVSEFRFRIATRLNRFLLLR